MKKQIAIKVENEREFDALMNVYEKRGWNHESGRHPVDVAYFKNAVNQWMFHDSFMMVGAGIGYTIISFPTFAQIAGIEWKEEVIIELANEDAEPYTATVNEKHVKFSAPVMWLSAAELTEI